MTHLFRTLLKVPILNVATTGCSDSTNESVSGDTTDTHNAAEAFSISSRAVARRELHRRRLHGDFNRAVNRG